VSDRNPIPLSLTTPMRFDQPLDQDDARQALHEIAAQRRQAREWYQRALESRADKERDYRKARAAAWAQHTDGTAKEREDRVNDVTADARYDRDVADGIVRAALERLAEVDGERASLHRLCDWSMRMMDVASREPADPQTFGRRAA
jgi:hypothetical protein